MIYVYICLYDRQALEPAEIDLGCRYREIS